MTPDEKSKPFVFPKWVNLLLPLLVISLIGGPLYVGILVPYALGPGTLNEGYAPAQEIPFSHKIHAGELGMDCRYCHNTVEKAAHAAIPPSQTCWNCHNDDKGGIHAASLNLQPLRDSMTTGQPIKWTKVHDLGDYAYFDHSVHLSAGVSCVQCHGRVDQMEVVTQVENLSMSWCLDCHRDPGPKLWPVEKVFDLDWQPPTGEKREQQIEQLLAKNVLRGRPDAIRRMTDCSVCHR